MGWTKYGRKMDWGSRPSKAGARAADAALLYHGCIRSSHNAAMSRGLRERKEEGEEKGYA